MSFATPVAFVLLAVPAVLAVVAAVAWRRRSAAAVRFAHVDVLAEVVAAPPVARRVLPGALALAALAVMVGGFAGPQRIEKVETERKQVVLAFDVSNSMMADDVEPTRLDAARDEAAAFLDAVPEDVDVGLVLFSGSVMLSRPPTEDRESLKSALSDAELGPGTAIGEAIYTGLGLLGGGEGDGEGPAGLIVVLSDGETTVGRPDDEAAAAARDVGVKVSTIAFGTDDGVITLPGTGERQAVPYQPEALAAIAEATGGTAAEAGSAGTLAEAFDDLERSVQSETRTVGYANWAFAVAFVLAAAGMALSLAWLRRLG